MTIQIECPHCHAQNRLDPARINDAPNCGACHAPLLTGAPLAATKDSLPQLLKHSKLPVVIDFWAPWCGPCQQFGPTFAAAAKDMAGKMLFVKVDTEAEPEMGQQFRVRSIPTLLVIEGNAELERVSGAMSAGQFKAWLMQFI
ncbi:thioredoxin TrxC [Chitinibacter fontanus]|uniref:Thioredoxin TrxC n=1 Tax=Chitinibacter fontanus TaxID=1737446 RepID=A0A7D5ZJZ3_9NEIS|nr:thioredoxin TrxC [Chitinibacter fontanus]QLI83107.1 thioredoxin TrxC [Chitinibacter fontanus]